MRVLIAVRIFALLVAALALAGCDPFSETWEWNQKLTVEVLTPDGPRSGSAVTKVRWQELNSSGNYPGSYRGEASVVELGGGRFLFALIGEEIKYIALRTFKAELGPDYSITERGFAAMARIRGTRDVPREHYPLLVTFTDLGNPTMVRKVDPDNLAATFGPGVALTQVSLEITDEEVTEGKVRNVLQWLSSVGDGMLDGRRTSTIKARNRLANDLTRLNFARD